MYYPDMVSESRYTAIEPVRDALDSLVDHYGSLGQVAQAIGVPYRTLQGINSKAHLVRVTTKTADKVFLAAADPPEVRTEDFWDKRYVELEKVIPFVDFLNRTYGTLAKVSQVTGIPVNTLRAIKHQSKRGVTKDLARRLSQAVLECRYGSRAFSTYENDGPPRHPTTQERDDRGPRAWQPAGGRVRVK